MDLSKKLIRCCRTCIHYKGKWCLNAVPMKCDYWKEKTLDFDCCHVFKLDENHLKRR